VTADVVERMAMRFASPRHSKFVGALLVVLAPVHAVANACPKNFGSFLKLFQSDRAYQERYIQYPLRHSAPQRGACYPDCPVVQKNLGKAEVLSRAEPIYPLLATQRAKGLQSEVTVERSAAVIQILLPESDAYRFEYRFVRKNSCWWLTQASDLAL